MPCSSTTWSAAPRRRTSSGATGRSGRASRVGRVADSGGRRLRHGVRLRPGPVRDELVILAARDFGGEPLARIHLPVRVPLRLHGNWVPDVRD
ncbi:carotenoid oxygenase family protein [Streptomyces sp. NPDC046876]|uniref:carotenoid oxygenase family protein n=1 Tax=Streptomyces sp. NPDC046876 TaxID=3155616 RepID=UPI0033CACF02